MERLFFVKSKAIEKRKLRAHAVSEQDMAKLMRQYGCKTGLVGKHVHQAPAQNDGVAHREGLHRRRHQNRQRTSGWISRLFVTSRLLTTVSSTLSTSPEGAIKPNRSNLSATLSSAWRSHARFASSGE